MKNKLVFFWTLATLLPLKGLDNYPLTLILKNNTHETLLVSVEYELDQHYTRISGPGTPFVPNNTKYFAPQQLTPGEEREIHVFAFSPCAKQFCFLENNLYKEGFKKHYKVIQGSITVRNRKRSYDFKEPVFDGGTVHCSIEKESLIITTTKSFKKMRECYQTGFCAA